MNISKMLSQISDHNRQTTELFSECKMNLITRLVIVLVSVNYGLAASLLYPYGAKHGDTKASPETYHPNEDVINLAIPLMVYGKQQNTLKICGNYGKINLKSDCSSEMVMFPTFHHDDGSISPFNVLQDVSDHGVWYRTTSKRKLLKRAKADVLKSFKGCVRRFKPKQLTIVTWLKANDVDKCETDYKLRDPEWCECQLGFTVDENGQTIIDSLKNMICDCAVRRQVDYNICFAISWYNRREYLSIENELARQNYWLNHNYTDPNPPKEELNTYQAVLMTDGRQTYVMFNYERLDWFYTNADTPNGYTRYKALVGISSEDSTGCTKYYAHPASGTSATLDLATTTNCGVPGRWLYGVNPEPIAAGCKELELTNHFWMTCP